jgi:hypothetical protein
MLRTLSALALAAGALAVTAPQPAQAQWSTTYEQFYLQAPHNWVFRNQYRGADRLFNAFDYGHAILYETLWTKPDAPATILEQKEYDYLTKKVLVSPPRVPLEEAAIEIKYAQLAPEAKQMFDWAHILHRQLYDILADERLSETRKDAEVARLVAYYKTRPDLAFSSKPKSMKLMQEQPYSLAFRTEYPKFNGLIWAYHWMQIGLYEPLVVNGTAETRQAGVRATVGRFWQMLANPPRTFPYQMPMTAAVAPKFAARYPEAAIIFDNLHSMHDVVSDILANDSVPRNRKRAEILLAARRFRDDTSYVMPVEAWLAMSRHMGVENMGGPAVGFLPPLPTPTVTYGAVMTHDDRTGEMTGFKYGEATGGAHGAAAQGGHAMDAPERSDSGTANAHAGHGGGPSDSTSAAAGAAGHTGDQGHGAHGPAGGMAHDSAHAAQMTELHQRMLADPVIRDRVLADTAMRRVMGEMIRDTTSGMSPEHRAHMREMMAAPRTARPSPARRPATSSPAPAARRSTPSRPAKRDPHAGHGAPAKPAARDTSAHHEHHQ